MENSLQKLYATRGTRVVRLDHATLFGALSAFGLVFLAIALGGGLSSFLDIKSLLIVLGGTIGATLVAFPMEELTRTLGIIRPAFFPDDSSAQERIHRLLEIANRARRNGALSLQADIYRESDPFLMKCIELLVDGLKPHEIKKTLEIDLSFLEDRNRRGAELFQTMGTIAPAMGLVGTLIGLVQMLQHLDNPAAVGPAMSLALLTTFYGAILAYIICFPIAAKLRARSREEAMLKEMSIEGVLCILEGLNPRILEQRLLSFLPPEQRVSQYGS